MQTLPGLRTTHGTSVRIRGMPGRQSAAIRGLRFTITPDSRLHRVLHYPFFFESTNYSFRIRIERVNEEEPGDPWPEHEGKRTILFAVQFENGDLTHRPKEVPKLEVGEHCNELLENIYVSYPGQTTILIDLNFQERLRIQKKTLQGVPIRAENLYSYRVRTEESLWVSGFVGMFAAISLFAAIFVPICTARLDKAPVVINEFMIPSIATPSPAVSDTLLTLTPSPESTPDTAWPRPQSAP